MDPYSIVAGYIDRTTDDWVVCTPNARSMDAFKEEMKKRYPCKIMNGRIIIGTRTIWIMLHVKDTTKMLEKHRVAWIGEYDGDVDEIPPRLYVVDSDEPREV